MKRTGRKRKKPVTVAPGMGGRSVETVDLPDPFEPHKLAPAQRVAQQAPIDRVFKRGRLANRNENPRLALLRLDAAKELQAIWERAGGKGAGAIDYSRVKVDTSFRYDGTPQTQAHALHMLAAIHKAIGADHALRLQSIICIGHGFYEVGREIAGWAMHGQRALDEYQALRDGLDRLIAFFGWTVRNRTAKV